MINIILGDKPALVPSCRGGRFSGWMRVCGWAGGPTETVCSSVCVSEVALKIWEDGCMGSMRSTPERHGR